MKHMEETQKRGIPLVTPELPDLSFDLDVPEDLNILNSIGYIIPVISNKTVEEKIP